MAKETERKDTSAGRDAAARLKEIRAKVDEIKGRLKTERDPAALKELSAEIGRLTTLLSELIGTAKSATDAVAKSGPVVWPRDLSASAGSNATWGRDPAEVVGG